MPNLAADPNVKIVSVSEKINGSPSLRFEVLNDDGTGFTYDTGTVVWVTMGGKTWFKGQVARVRLNKSNMRTTYDVRSVIDLIANKQTDWVRPRINTPDPLVPEGQAFDPAGTSFDEPVSDVVAAEDFSTWFSAVNINVDGPAGTIKDTKGLDPITYLKKLTALLPNATFRYSLTPGPTLFPAGTLTVFDNSVDPGATHTITNSILVDYDLVKDASKTGDSVLLRGKGDYTYTSGGGVVAPIGGAVVNFGSFSYDYSRGPFQKPVINATTITLPAPVGDPKIPSNKLPPSEEPPVPFVIERQVGLNISTGAKDWQSVGSPKYIEGREDVLIGQFNDLFKIQGVIPLNVTFRTRYTTWAPLEENATVGSGVLSQDMVFDLPQILKYQGDWVNADQSSWDQLVAAYGALYGTPKWSGTIDVTIDNPATCLDWVVGYTLGDGVAFAVDTCLPTGIGNLMINQIDIKDVEKGIVRLHVGPFLPQQNPFIAPSYPGRQKGEEAPQLGGGGGGGGGGEGQPKEAKKGGDEDNQQDKDGANIGGPGGEGGAATAKADKADNPKTTKTDGSESTYTEYDTIKVLDPNATGTEITLCDSGGSEFTIVVFTEDDFFEYNVVDAVSIGQLTNEPGP